MLSDPLLFLEYFCPYLRGFEFKESLQVPVAKANSATIPIDLFNMSDQNTNDLAATVDDLIQRVDGNDLFIGFRFPIQKLFSLNFLDGPRELDEKIERGLAFKSGTERIASNMKKKERNLSLAIILIVLIIFCITCVPIAILITLLAIFI